jgi:hypothetical protein
LIWLGTLLGRGFWDELPIDRRVSIAPQIASIIKAFQTIRLPTSNTPFGGFAFDDEGKIKYGPHPLGYGGPYSNSFEYFRGMVKEQLVAADSNKVIKGWRGHTIRERIVKFVEDPNGLAKVVRDLEDKATFCHFDFGDHSVHPITSRAPA